MLDMQGLAGTTTAGTADMAATVGMVDTGGTVEAQRMRGGVSQALQCLLPIGIAE